MKKKKIRTRCAEHRALRELKIFQPKTIPNKKGKGVVYNRAKSKDRGSDLGPYSFDGIDASGHLNV